MNHAKPTCSGMWLPLVASHESGGVAHVDQCSDCNALVVRGDNPVPLVTPPRPNSELESANNLEVEQLEDILQEAQDVCTDLNGGLGVRGDTRDHIRGAINRLTRLLQTGCIVVAVDPTMVVDQFKDHVLNEAGFEDANVELLGVVDGDLIFTAEVLE